MPSGDDSGEGKSLFSPGCLQVSMDLLHGVPSAPDACHEFIGSKASWYVLLDIVPRYEKGIT